MAEEIFKNQNNFDYYFSKETIFKFVLLVFIMLSIKFFLNSAIADYTIDDIFHLSSGETKLIWQYRDDVIPEKNREAAAWLREDSANWKSIEPNQFRVKDLGKLLWLRTTLPKKISYDSILVISINQKYFEAWLDGKNISNRKYSTSIPLKLSYSEFAIELHEEDAGKNLFVQIRPTNQVLFRDTPKIEQLSSGIYKNFVGGLEKFVFATIYLFLGAMAICLYFRNKQSLLIAREFGFFVLVWGIYILTRVEFIATLARYNLILLNTELFILFLSPIAYSRFVKHIMGLEDQVHSFIESYFYLFVAFSLCYGLYANELTGVLVYWQYSAVAAMVASLFVIIRSAIGGKYEARIMCFGMIFAFGSGILDILSLINVIKFPITIFYYGLSVLMLSLGYIVLRRIEGIYSLLRSYSKELAVSNQRLQELDKIKDDFLANTSHELRTPLNGIIGLTESLLADNNNSFTPLQKKNLSLVLASARRLGGLVNDILDFSKMRKKNIVICKKSVNLAQVISIVFSICEPMARRKNIKLEMLIAEEFPKVMADSERLQQILLNLIGNAIKYTDNGGVKVFAEEIDTKIVVHICDTGIGISKSDIENIFKAFEQAHAKDHQERNASGTGLGLAITKNLVELHGGKLEVTSKVNLGSTFSFTLEKDPQNTVEENAESEIKVFRLAEGSNLSTGTPENVESVQNMPQKRNKILAVDDDPVNLDVIVAVLGNYFEIETCQRGDEALANIEKSIPDLVLLDIMMPQKSGYEVCKEIRKKYTSADLPVILLTARGQVQDLIQGFNSGANDYIGKPFARDELLARITSLISLVSTHREVVRSQHRMKTILSATCEMTLLHSALDICCIALNAICDELVSKEYVLDAEISVASFHETSKGDDEATKMVDPSNSHLFFKAKKCHNTGGFEIIKNGLEEGGDFLLQKFLMDKLIHEIPIIEKGHLIVPIFNKGVHLATLAIFDTALEASEAQLAYVSAVATSTGVVLENQRLLEKERSHLLDIVSIAAQISDKINSPLCVLSNLSENILSIVDSPIQENEDSGTKVLQFLNKRSNFMRSALHSLKDVSESLVELRDIISEQEATESLTSGRIQIFKKEVV